MTDDQDDAQHQLEYAAQQAAAYLQDIAATPDITAGQTVMVLLTAARDRRDLGEPLYATALVALAERISLEYRHAVLTSGMTG